MKLFFITAGALVFIFSAAAHIYVKIKLRPPQNSELDEVYWEFEDSVPELKKYDKLCKMTFTAVCLGILLLFLAVVI